MSLIKAIHKFGGTSLADAACFLRVKALLNDTSGIIVVSATAGTTDSLQALLEAAMTGEQTTASLNHLKQRHFDLIDELLPTNRSLKRIIEADTDAIAALLQSVLLLGDYSLTLQALLLGFGERWSSQILSALLGEKSVVIDAYDCLFVDDYQGRKVVDWQQSAEALASITQAKSVDYWVFTGFVARNTKGLHTTLGRNGSDFSAAIVARLTLADSLTIWTDVDGIYTADPRRVPSAFVLDELSYKEALELAYYGASVICPQAMQPAIDCQIPIRIKNTFKPDATGSLIHGAAKRSPHAIRGLSAVENISLINIEGTGMMGVSGMVARVFDALKLKNVSVFLISQASSEHSVCLAVNDAEAKLALTTLQTVFEFECERGLIDNIHLVSDCAIIVAVGDAMVGRLGVAAKLLTQLSLARINVLALSQGSSERNISVVIHREETSKALRVCHSGFYLSNRTLSIGLIGPGNVGKALLNQLAVESSRLKTDRQINLHLRGIANSKKMLLSEKPIALTEAGARLVAEGEACCLDQFAAHILSDDRPHSVIIDCTASAQVASRYQQFIEQGLHIVTPNKHAVSSDEGSYQSLFAACKTAKRHFLYETNVCAGLPVIKTIQDLVQTGDRIRCIEGVVSGTLSFVFNQLSAGESFSSVIKKAFDAGFTEPDPRDDLSGQDVAKKCVCLAREIGLKLELSDVTMVPLLPKDMSALSLDDFWQALPTVDESYAKQVASAQKNSAKLAYIGKITDVGSVSIELQQVGPKSPFAALFGTDNMLVIHSERYHDNPLVVQGPGAGVDVTAAGIFADLLRLVSLVS